MKDDWLLLGTKRTNRKNEYKQNTNRINNAKEEPVLEHQESHRGQKDLQRAVQQLLHPEAYFSSRR